MSGLAGWGGGGDEGAGVSEFFSYEPKLKINKKTFFGGKWEGGGGG